jgi:hypothetical protein
MSLLDLGRSRDIPVAGSRMREWIEKEAALCELGAEGWELVAVQGELLFLRRRAE